MLRLCAPTDEAGVTIDEIVRACSNMGVHVVEIRKINNKEVLELSESEAQEYFTKLQAKQIEAWSICSTIGRNDLNIDINAFNERINKAIKLADIFKAKYLRVSGFFNHNNNVDEIVKRLTLVVNTANANNLKVVLENHKDTYTDNIDRMNEILNKVPGLLSIFDAANYLQVGEATDKAQSTMLPKAEYVHFKDGILKSPGVIETVPAGEGQTNLAGLVKIVNKDMPISIEHRLRYPLEGETFESIQGSQKFVYPNLMSAFFDAVGHVRMLLLRAGYMEIHEGLFKR